MTPTYRLAPGISDNQRTVYERGDRSERIVGFIQLMNIRGARGWRFLANRSDVAEPESPPLRYAVTNAEEAAPLCACGRWPTCARVGCQAPDEKEA